MLLADIFVTVKPGREDITNQSLNSLIENTNKNLYRLTICVDGKSSVDYREFADYVIYSNENEGLAPTVNRAISHISSINNWYSNLKYGDFKKVSPYIVMCQDDLIYTPQWLEILAKNFALYSSRLGFVTGLECVEHTYNKVVLPNGNIQKDWIRAAQMMARREYWESMMPIPIFDPETGNKRAKPNDGIGSGVDWWFIRNHPNSVTKIGKTCLVVPGLVKHLGYDRSTWLNRELPESQADKNYINSYKEKNAK